MVYRSGGFQPVRAVAAELRPTPRPPHKMTRRGLRGGSEHSQPARATGARQVNNVGLPRTRARGLAGSFNSQINRPATTRRACFEATARRSPGMTPRRGRLDASFRGGGIARVAGATPASRKPGIRRRKQELAGDSPFSEDPPSRRRIDRLKILQPTNISHYSPPFTPG